MRRHLSSAVVIASIAALPLLASVTASAEDQPGASQHEPAVMHPDDSCPDSGHVTNWDVCTTLTGGILHLDENNDGSDVSVWYHKSSGDPVSGYLKYERGGTTHSSGKLTFSQSLDQEYDWSPAASCSDTVGIISTSDGQWQTPAAPGC